MTVDIEKIKSGLSLNQFQDGECNCLSCRKARGLGNSLEKIMKNFPNVPIVPDRYNFQQEDNIRAYYWRSCLQGSFSSGIAAMVRALSELEAENAKVKANSKWYKRFPEKYTYCPDCGRLFNAATYGHEVKHHTDMSPRIVCGKCKKSYKVCADGCSSAQYFVHELKQIKGRHVCTKCVESNYRTCRRCSSIRHKRDVRILDGQLLQDCDRVLRRRGSDHDGGVICNDCHEKTITRCADCNREMYSFCAVSFNFPDGSTGYRCKPCHDERRVIQNYSYKPFPKWARAKTQPKEVRSDSLMMGIELEQEQKRRTFSEMDRIPMSILSREDYAYLQVKKTLGKDLAYAKSDGSLDNGIEVVTHPFSVEHFKEHADVWQKFFDNMKEANWRVSRRCGSHMHLTRDAFTSLQLYKFVNFIYSESNRAFVLDISERDPDAMSYCRFRSDDARHTKYIAKHKELYSGQRNSAINMSPRYTIELRFFGGVSSYLSLAKNVEFVASLYEYTKFCKPLDIGVLSYCKWLAVNGKSYKHLLTFLGESEVFQNRYEKSYGVLKSMIEQILQRKDS